jgi:CRP-like cAMP-binding protein
MNKGQKVFNFGDIGSLFYVIVKGDVAVKVPTKLSLKMGYNE